MTIKSCSQLIFQHQEKKQKHIFNRKSQQLAVILLLISVFFYHIILYFLLSVTASRQLHILSDSQCWVVFLQWKHRQKCRWFYINVKASKYSFIATYNYAATEKVKIWSIFPFLHLSVQFLFWKIILCIGVNFTICICLN